MPETVFNNFQTKAFTNAQTSKPVLQNSNPAPLNKDLQKQDLTLKTDVAEFSVKKPDIAEYQTPIQKENKTNIGKIIAGLSVAVAGIGVLLYLFKHRKMPNASAGSLGNTERAARQGRGRAKDVARQAADGIKEHIDFKKAKSVEEAKQYGINNFGIEEYIGFCDKKQDLEILNWINEGLTNVSNRAKGKVDIPKCIYFGNDMPAGTACGCNTTTTVDGHVVKSLLGINKKTVNEMGDFLTDLKDNITRLHIAEKGQDGKFVLADCFADNKKSRKFLEYMEMIENGQIKTFEQKIKAQSYLMEYQEVLERAVRAPYITIKNAPALKNNTAVQNRIEALKDAALDVQADYLDDVLYDSALNFKLDSQPISHFKTIYHEMGHINDKLQQQRPDTTITLNHDYSKYPKELKEWVDNAQNMQIANSVSLYSADGPGEFVAEVFARTLNGAKFPKAVMDLYKKLSGPKI